MIFSGRVISYRCDACASEYSDVMPTSLLPIFGVVTLATTFWSRAISEIVSFRWLSIVLGVAASIASLWGMFALIDALTTRKLRRGVCPKCGGKLAQTASGFYDTIVPEPWEVLVYSLTVALAFGVAVAAR